MMKIAILGSTGSIGTQTLDIVREQGDIQVTAIAAGSNIKKLEEQMREFHPLLVCVFQEDARSHEGSEYPRGVRHGWTSGGGGTAGERDPCDGDCRDARHKTDDCSH